jgi:hypothetical protein
MSLLRSLRDELSAVLDAPSPTDPPAAATSGSMLDRWEPWYASGHRACYGPSDTYQIAAEWLKGLSIEDWGCGYAQFRDFHHGHYRGVDGTQGWADVVADLTKYRPDPRPEGILIRHVLEHNPDWRLILANAVASFTKRMVLVVFTPDAGPGQEKILAHVSAVNVDDLSLSHAEIESFFSECKIVEKRHVPTATGYEGETVWRVER